MDPMPPGFHFGFGELKAVVLACGIILGWAFLRYVARQTGSRDLPIDLNDSEIKTRTPH